MGVRRFRLHDRFDEDGVPPAMWFFVALFVSAVAVLLLGPMLVAATDPAASVMLVAMASAVCGVAVIVVLTLWHFLRRKNDTDPAELRRRRLTNVLECLGAGDRLPHRRIEFALLRYGRRRAYALGEMNVPPGCVVSLGGERLDAVRPGPHYFELIDLQRERARLLDLCQARRTDEAMRSQRPADAGASSMRDDEHHDGAVVILGYNPGGMSPWQLFAIGLLPLACFGGLGFAVLVLVPLSMLALVIRPRSLGRHYLAPAALIVMRGGPLSEPSIDRFTANGCGLLIDAGAASGGARVSVSDAMGPVSLWMSATALEAFLTAWLSTAPPPTEEQVRQALGYAS